MYSLENDKRIGMLLKAEVDFVENNNNKKMAFIEKACLCPQSYQKQIWPPLFFKKDQGLQIVYIRTQMLREEIK